MHDRFRHLSLFAVVHPLSVQPLAKCKFHKSFVLIFMQNARGCTLPRRSDAHLDRTGRRRLAALSSINHDPCYHGLYDLSNTIMVLVFSQLPSFVRKILQGEENKGVEFTVHRGNGLREGSSESKKKKKKRQLPHPCTTRKSGTPAKREYCMEVMETSEG